MEAERLYALLANIPDVVWTTDSQGRTTFISPNVEQVYGFTPDEILQAGSELWLDRIHPDDVAHVREAYESLLTRDEMFDVEYRIRHRDGHWIWLHDRATVSYDRDGVKYADGVFSDVTAHKEAEAQRDTAREALQKAHDELEQRVSERTAELTEANARLQAEIAERRRAEQALQESAKQLQNLVENMPIVCFTFDRQGHILSWNRAAEQVYGYTRDEAVGASAYDLIVTPQTKEATDQVIQRVFAGETIAGSEWQDRNKAGELGWRMGNTFPLLNADGSVAYGVNLNVDITKRVQAETALQESLQTAADIVQAIPSGLFIYQYKPSDRLVLLDGNPAAERLTGIDVLKWRGHEFDEIWPQARANGITEAFLSVVKTGETFATEDQQYADERLEGAFRIHAFRMPGGRLGVAFENITARKQAEMALHESERRFRELFEKAPLCIFELDLVQTPPVILHANSQAARVYGWSRDEFVSIPLGKIIPPGAVAEIAQVVDALKEGRALTVESVNQRRDGSEFPVRISAATELGTDLSRIIVMVEDITIERERRSEEEAIAEERRRIAREIHDGLAQDLAALRVRVGLWHDLVDGDAAQMHAELDDLQALLRQNIRDVRRAIFALRPVALDELGFYPAIRRFAGDFGEQNQLHVDLRILGSQGRLPSQLEPMLFRIIQEALNNVGKHARASAAWVELNLESAKTVKLTVWDDGVGFDPQTLVQARQRGHVGLAQMRERVERIGGELKAESQAGKGTIIRVALPLPVPQGGH